MTLRFVDGFDHYDTASLGAKWTVVGAPTINATGGRRGTGALTLGATGRYLQKTFDNQQQWTVGRAINFTAYPSSGVSNFFELLDGATTQLSLAINTVGNLVLYRGRLTTSLATSVNTLVTGTWNYIEVYSLISNTAGTGRVIVRVNGSSDGWIDFTGDTCANANEYASIVGIGEISSTQANHVVDDVYICDGQGAVNNTFLGDSRVDSFMPASAGGSTQFTPSAGSNFECVDDNPPNGDTDYAESSTIGHIDTYTFAPMTHTPSAIFGVQIVADAKKDDAGTRSIAGICNSGSSGNVAGTTQALTTSYVMYHDIRELDPNTSAAWSKAGINAATYGVTVAA